MQQYAIRGGAEGKARLRLLSQVLETTTGDLLRRAGLREGAVALDVGCGGGDVTLQMARCAGSSGRVVGIDMDAVKIRLASQDAAELGMRNVEFRVANVDDFDERSAYDVVYARFLLSHLRSPHDMLVRMMRAARARGTVVAEDIDHTGVFCEPRCAAVERYVELYRSVVHARGGDGDLGRRLPKLFLDAGFASVHVGVVQPMFLHGEGKSIHQVTLANIADAVIAERLASRAEIDALIVELDEFVRDQRTVVALPRVFQAWSTVA